MNDHVPARCCRHVFTPACPIDCVQAVLSMATFNTLARAEGAPFDSPPTVGQVIALLRQKRLNQATRLGPRRLGEIQAGLVVAGLVIGDVTLPENGRAPDTPGSSPVCSSDEKKEPPPRVTAATSPAPAGVAVPATPALPRRARDALSAAGPGSSVQPAAGPDMLRRVLDGLHRL
jgi:hypothetical protein